ncbi:MAG: hypothetical protein V2I40_04415 [Desulfobacteraceae bacterium]|nr:hypothetical protein [Desulfobacteraceae bacterium]
MVELISGKPSIVLRREASGLLQGQAVALLESKDLDRRIVQMTAPANAFVDRAFGRGLILIGLLIAGFGLLRLIPRRVKDGKR